MAFQIPRPMMTKEHGSWAVLLIPMALAIGRTGVWNSDSLVFIAAAFFAFLGYLPVQTLLRDRFGIPQGPTKMTAAKLWASLFVAASGSLTALLVLKGYVMLVAFGAFAILYFLGNFFLMLRFQKSVASDLVGMAGLTLGAPALWYVQAGTIGAEALSLYVLSFLFFGCSVVYVHLKIRVVEMRRDDLSAREKLSAARLNIVYHLAVIAIVVALAVWQWTPAMTVIAFVPMTIHALYGTYKLSHRVRFKRLGFLLLAHSVLFAILLLIVPGK